jgi:hypothetical protein
VQSTAHIDWVVLLARNSAHSSWDAGELQQRVQAQCCRVAAAVMCYTYMLEAGQLCKHVSTNKCLLAELIVSCRADCD